MDLFKAQKAYAANVDPAKLDKLAAEFGVLPRSLSAYGIGYDPALAAWTVPMFNGQADAKQRLRPCGFRIRSVVGGKWGVAPGSENGVFVADDCLEVAKGCEALDVTAPLLFVVPGDVRRIAAVRNAGFACVGRPTACSSAAAVANLVCRMPPPHLVVVAEMGLAKWDKSGAQFPGISGSLELAGRLMGSCKPLRFVMSDPGGLPATFERFALASMEAPVVTRAWLERAWNRYYDLCKEQSKVPAKQAS